ncbi:phosphocholine-specific phospholipase C [Asticcacaulis sp. AND118]|uniref:phosphocholine-specific phospholipase C n=1 Tax=Asticcacaulis sp. AND118 TaxID=2840468 RepID=UPI001CFFB42B|nr:phospholipase C, phosphocholine-specific [Asticcacaulis sp. AND118]UDF02955.1 phospholipase C, phosphocholine-specific [Asticcacaulis sp. AND118]
MTSRRTFLSAALAASLGGLPPAIARALDIPANTRTGTIKDVEHVVILMQENRSFDHYFGAMNGVQGFGDRFAIPTAKDRTVFAQPREDDATRLIAPFALNTAQDFRLMRVEGTPHSFKDAQAAWDEGRMSHWPKSKHNHAMAHFERADLPFQYALAEAFTLCDAYFCAMHSGTNPNRVFHWTGKNVGPNGPVIDNGYDELKADPKGHGGYDWTTYPERLGAAGIDWRVYQNMKDNFTDNPLVGFKTYRAADKATSGKLADLADRSVRTRDLDKLKEDVLAGKLPQVSWIVGTAEGSEHPSTSSPAQGADYTAKVLDALTANPDVWARTVLLINFDENDGYFDHVPPPAPPSLDNTGQPLGSSDVDASAEYHQGDDAYKNRPYGLGPRVPLYVISPWSKGGYVASEVFDHTSVIRFLETRFGVPEPNISAWRRAVCGDLTSCFDFRTPNDQPFFAHLPRTGAQADKARKLGGETKPRTPDALTAPVQEQGQRPRRATPYALGSVVADGHLICVNNSANRGANRGAAVFHVYDLDDLSAAPRRFTVTAGKVARHRLADKPVRLWINGPNGFHRRFEGLASFTAEWGPKGFEVTNRTAQPLKIEVRDEAYGRATLSYDLQGHETRIVPVGAAQSHGWYDFTITGKSYVVRCAGHVEDGQPSLSDPAAFGTAKLAV